jgi:hypothetical protein
MEFKTCGNCFVHLPINEFGKKRNLEIYKHCGNCRLIKKRSYSNNKEKRVCPHGLTKYYCPKCKELKKILKDKDQVIVIENNKKEEFFKLICTKIDEYYTQEL